MTKECMEILLTDLSVGFFMKQVLVIMGLFLLGLSFLQIAGRNMESKWKCLLAFPTGLALWCIDCFLILTLGIPFTIWSALITLVVLILLLVLAERKNFTAKTDKEEQAKRRKTFLIAVCIAFVAACIATSGIISFSVSNDTMYYYLYYPEVLVSNGGYATAYDTFLSDVGPMAAIIGTLPSMFGFDQIYGIHQFFNLNFILLFAYIIFEKSNKELSAKSAIVIALVGTVLLVTSTPYLVISKWVLANAYVMYYSSILLFLAYKFRPSDDKEDGNGMFPMVVCFVLMGMISMLRMEGCVVACFIIVCMSTLRYSNRELVCSVMIPTMLFPILYFIRYFLILKVSPHYSFLTPQKALLMITAMLILLGYLLIIRGKRFMKLQSKMRILILLALIVGNGVLLIVSPSDYLAVIRAFYGNISNRQGWGYSVELVVICYCITLILSGIVSGFRLKYADIAYEDLILIGFVFILLTASYARGGGLRYGIGDSGNRVMMQVIPLAWYAVISKVIYLMKEYRYADNRECR